MAKHVLIVDDSQIVLNLHRYILEEAGFQCTTAENGFVALELLAQDQFDLVITDINMPRMDGYELTRKIREMDDYKHIPIIIISTEQEAQDKNKGFEAGANAYIVKPAEPENLIMNVNMLLSAA